MHGNCAAPDALQVEQTNESIIVLTSCLLPFTTIHDDVSLPTSSPRTEGHLTRCE